MRRQASLARQSDSRARHGLNVSAMRPPLSSARRSAEIWTVKLLSSTTVARPAAACARPATDAQAVTAIGGDVNGAIINRQPLWVVAGIEFRHPDAPLSGF